VVRKGKTNTATQPNNKSSGREVNGEQKAFFRHLTQYGFMLRSHGILRSELYMWQLYHFKANFFTDSVDEDTPVRSVA
jgi:hypothetical protein